jgi:predicted RNA binding protein YcfA (HicA-like mRNA interferase family)
MTRLPGVRPRALVAALKRDGFVERHRKGSHLYLWHPRKRRMTSVPMHPGDVNRKLVHAILDQAGLTPEDLLRLL